MLAGAIPSEIWVCRSPISFANSASCLQPTKTMAVLSSRRYTSKGSSVDDDRRPGGTSLSRNLLAAVASVTRKKGPREL